MFPAQSKKITLTLVCYVALALLMTDTTQAKSYVQRRDHADLNRMIRKHAHAEYAVDNLFNRALGDPLTSQSTTDSVIASSSQPNPASLPASTSSSPTVSPSSTTPSGGLGGIIGLLTDSRPSPSSSMSSSSSSSVSASSSVPPSSSSSVMPSSTSSSASDTSISGNANSAPEVQTVTRTNLSPSNSGTLSAAASSSSSSSTHTTIIVVIAVASCIVGVAVVWTLIRKWKFRPSSQFEDRMQPIDWEPAVSDDEPGLHRNASTASHGSFHSSSAYINDRINPIPDHDFTAGPAQLAPVGGYADLARGPSPQPQQMQEALTRSPTMVRPTYDQYGVPLHHQGGYDAYSVTAGARY